MEAAKRKVLVIDDEVELCELMELHLKAAGFEISKAYNAKDALEILEGNSKVDFIVTDVRLPKKSGPELIREVQGRGTNIPFLMITGFSDVDADDAADMGAVALLQKPADLPKIAKVITRFFSPKSS